MSSLLQLFRRMTYFVLATMMLSGGAFAALVVAAPPAGAVTSISPSTLPNGTVGNHYIQALVALGGTGNQTWVQSTAPGQTGLPPGIGFSTTGNGGRRKGLLSGTPTTAGTYTFTVAATNNGGMFSQPYTLVITSPLAITTPTLLPAGTTHVAYSQTLTATGGLTPYTWSTSRSLGQTGLPPGIRRCGNCLSGDPRRIGTYTFNIRVRDSSSPHQTVTQAETLIVTAAPTGLSGVSNTTTSITLSWNAVSNALRYNVYRSSTPGGPYAFAGNTTALTWTNHLNVPPGSTFYYVVTSVVGSTVDQQSANSTEAAVTILSPPPAPTGLTATPGSDSQINVSWNPVMGATSYTVSGATTSGGPYTVLSRQPGTTYANNGLAPGTTHYYVVTATTSIGTSVNSTEASGTTLAQPLAPVATATPGSDSQINVSWNPVMGATSYTVSGATISGGPYTVLSRQPGTTYANNGLAPGTTHYYVVTATTSAGTSVNSTEASATTLAQPVAPVATATVFSATSVHVAWSAVTAPGSTGPTTYDVYSSTTSGGPYTLKAVLTTTSWPNNGLTHGTTYYYVVKAVVPGVGTSPLSTEVSATP